MVNSVVSQHEGLGIDSRIDHGCLGLFCMWVTSGYSVLLPQPKDMRTRSSGCSECYYRNVTQCPNPVSLIIPEGNTEPFGRSSVNNRLVHLYIRTLSSVGNTVGYNQYSRRPSQEGSDRTGGHRNPPHVPENQVPPRRHREHNWKPAGKTDCSLSCGRGQNQTL